MNGKIAGSQNADPNPFEIPRQRFMNARDTQHLAQCHQHKQCVQQHVRVYVSAKVAQHCRTLPSILTICNIMSPREYGAFLAAQAQKWPPVIKAANMQPQ
jgi:hypothetical protein